MLRFLLVAHQDLEDVDFGADLEAEYARLEAIRAAKAAPGAGKV